MQLKTFLLSVLALAISANVLAQDKIFKTDGEIIDAKIKTVGVKTITYTRFDNQSGPEYTIIKVDVEKIRYQNGSEDYFEHRVPRHHMVRHNEAQNNEPEPAMQKTAEQKTEDKVNYGRNLLALAPVQFTENGLGFCVSYDRVIDKAGIVAFSVPIIATFNLNNGTYYNNNTGTVQNGHEDAMVYAMPGLKLYPTGCYGRVKYGIGPSLVVASGQKSAAVYDNLGNSSYQTQTHNLLGMMIVNTLNINPSAHVYVGFEFGLGFTYLNQVGGLNQDTNAIVEGSFKIGYRF